MMTEYSIHLGYMDNMTLLKKEKFERIYSPTTTTMILMIHCCCCCCREENQNKTTNSTLSGLIDKFFNKKKEMRI